MTSEDEKWESVWMRCRLRSGGGKRLRQQAVGMRTRNETGGRQWRTCHLSVCSAFKCISSRGPGWWMEAPWKSCKGDIFPAEHTLGKECKSIILEQNDFEASKVWLASSLCHKRLLYRRGPMQHYTCAATHLCRFKTVFSALTVFSVLIYSMLLVQLTKTTFTGWKLAEFRFERELSSLHFVH